MPFPAFADFIVSFPELESAGEDLYNAKAAEADALVAAAAPWSSAQRAVAVQYKTAHLIALSPYGQQARLVVTDKRTAKMSTTYGAHFDNMVENLGTGAMLA